MKELDPKQLTPVFYSEISSSYLLREILNAGYPSSDQNSIDFLSFVHSKYPDFFDPNGFHLVVPVQREHSYKGKGAIDLLLRLRNGSGEEAVVLIEVKVHDYLSATPHQIKTYLQAALDEEQGSNTRVYFVYLTQFTYSYLYEKTDCSWPGTITEFDRAQSDFKNLVAHLSWLDFYDFIDQVPDIRMDNTIKHLLELQRAWMQQKIIDDLEENMAAAATRAFEYYFPNTPQRITELIPLGLEPKQKKTGEELRIQVSKLAPEDFTVILNVIRNYGDGPDAQRVKSQTYPATIAAVQKFLSELAYSEKDWPMLSFYAELFHYASNSHLTLNGTGTRGFSIRLTTVKGDNISLCTLWNSGAITFRLSR